MVLEPAPEGGWIVRSPIIPELVTEVDDILDLEETVKDAVAAAKEFFQDLGKRFPNANKRRQTVGIILGAFLG